MAEDNGEQDRPTLASLFTEYGPEIRTIFARIMAETNLLDVPAAQLEFTESSTTMLFRCVPSERRVLTDWRGVASLWAMSQAVGRLSPAMFNARRNDAERVELLEGSAELLGHHFIDYAKQLCVPNEWRWNTYFPKPDRSTASDSGRVGDNFFFRGIEWILRHEIGHIALNHSDTVWSTAQSCDEERDADQMATRGLKGGLVADLGRPLGSKPSDKELELERRALSAGIGLLWIGIYEDTRTQTNDFYPPISDRMFRCIEEFGLHPDSVALEILSDFIKAWIDPEGDWPVMPFEEPTAQAAVGEAFRRLDEYARKVRG